jgi:hypothetical protein
MHLAYNYGIKPVYKDPKHTTLEEAHLRGYRRISTSISCHVEELNLVDPHSDRFPNPCRPNKYRIKTDLETQIKPNKRHLVLSRDLVASDLLDPFLGTSTLLVDMLRGSGWRRKVENVHITQSNHADRLPNAKTNARSNATVQALHTVVSIDVSRRLTDGQVLRTVRVHGLALHLDADDLDGLVPRGQTTTKRRREDLLHDAELLALLFARDPADACFSNTRETETRAPVGDLADRNGVDTLVDTANAFLAPDLHEGLHSARRLHAGRRDFVFCDLHRLHARAETHSRVGLGKTTDHTARDTRDEVVGAEGLGVELGLGGDEEEDSTLGGGFNPGPGNETLVDCGHFC